MNLSKSIDCLFENACVNIRYLLHRDILKTPIDSPEMKNMQADILQSPVVKKVLSLQHPDGWLGNELHGGNGMDSLMSVLLRSGVEENSDPVLKAVNALITPAIANQHKNHFAAGDALDADGRGGNKSITAWILATAGFPEDSSPLSDEITLSLKHLSGALEHRDIKDFTKQGSKFKYYKPSVKFPGANHIGILANTHIWQTDENLITVKKAMTHCYLLMKNVADYIMFRKPKEFGKSYMGPFNYGWQSLNPIEMQDFQKMVNNAKNRFQFGFYIRDLSGHPMWAIQTTQPYEFLADMLEKDTLMDLMTGKALTGFKYLWGIEPNWRSKTSVKCDLIYRILNTCWRVLEGNKNA
jgi:hypothetical protein